MAKSFLILFSIISLISCGSGGSGGGADVSPRENKIQNIVSQGFKGRSDHLDGVYLGKCSSEFTSQGRTLQFESCKLLVVITKNADSLEVTVDQTVTMKGEETVMPQVLIDQLFIKRNQLISNHTDEVIGEIGSIGLGIKGNGNGSFLQILTSGDGVYYFDGRIYNEQEGSSLTANADLKKL